MAETDVVSENEVAECPGCACKVPIKSNQIKGEFFPCPDCGEMLEIISMNPPILDFQPPDLDDFGE